MVLTVNIHISKNGGGKNKCKKKKKVFGFSVLGVVLQQTHISNNFSAVIFILMQGTKYCDA